MGTILWKGFAQAQVHTEFIAVCTSAFPKIIVPMEKLHALIADTAVFIIICSHNF